MEQSYDVVMIGAGISGINAAYRLQEQLPGRTYTILESKDKIGGTWELFKYPGIRSDSDMYTFGFGFRPWTDKATIAEAPLILRYLRETVSVSGIDKHIQFGHSVDSADWSSHDQSWTLTVTADGRKKTIRCKFLTFCTGYYNHKSPLSAQIPGIDNFKGKVIHPQFWPEDLDYTGKTIAVIGSGATATTLIPNLAKKAAKVYQIQRSPSFYLAVPQDDPINVAARRILSVSWAAKFIRLKFVIMPWVLWFYCRTFPESARAMLKKGTRQQLPKDYPLEPNFEPKYGPWEQRMCLTPEGDYFDPIKSGKATIITSTIDNVSSDTIHLANKEHPQVKPDIIVTATGLRVQVVGGIRISVDGAPIQIQDKYLWKSTMLQDAPNCANIVGYTNQSWTLGADCASQMITTLLKYMDRYKYTSVVPRVPEKKAAKMKEVKLLDLNSTYIVKARGSLPKAGDMYPWGPRGMYLKDLWDAKYGSYEDLDFDTVKRAPIDQYVHAAQQTDEIDTEDKEVAKRYDSAFTTSPVEDTRRG